MHLTNGEAMASAGYCRSCGMNVYLTTDGGCPQGHGPEAIQDVYEVPDLAPATGVAGGEPKKKSNTLLIVGIVVAVCLLAGCMAVGILSAISIPVFNSASETAQERACFANQRTIEGVAQQMYAADGIFPSEILDLVDAGYLLEFPECLSGGEYIYSTSDATVECSVHGHFE